MNMKGKERGNCILFELQKMTDGEILVSLKQTLLWLATHCSLTMGQESLCDVR